MMKRSMNLMVSRVNHTGIWFFFHERSEMYLNNHKKNANYNITVI